MRTATLIALAAAAAPALAQDPAQGWLAYGRVRPVQHGRRLTSISARWKVPANPRDSSAFFSPWFGIDPEDNLNLLQPVNPWFGSAPWVIYNEYYQWSPSYNFNSAQHNVNAGDELFGSITYEAAENRYVIYHNSSDGWSVSTPIKIQKDATGNFKNYSIAYFVFEKVAACGDYPPDEKVVFYDVDIRYDGVHDDAGTIWDTGVVDDVCQFAAHIDTPSTSAGQVSITWSTSAEDPAPERIAASQAEKRLSGRVPEKAQVRY